MVSQKNAQNNYSNALYRNRQVTLKNTALNFELVRGLIKAAIGKLLFLPCLIAGCDKHVQLAKCLRPK